MASSPVQYDIRDVEAWLSGELPFKTAEEAYGRTAGYSPGGGHMHDATNKIADRAGILDVCPAKAEIEQTITDVAGDGFRRPVMMLAIDGAHAPVRPEPSPRMGKRGKGEWKEAKGFGPYLIDGRRILWKL